MWDGGNTDKGRSYEGVTAMSKRIDSSANRTTMAQLNERCRELSKSGTGETTDLGSWADAAPRKISNSLSLLLGHPHAGHSIRPGQQREPPSDVEEATALTNRTRPRPWVLDAGDGPFPSTPNTTSVSRINSPSHEAIPETGLAIIAENNKTRHCESKRRRLIDTTNRKVGSYQ
jgi:hypothetical protein